MGRPFVVVSGLPGCGKTTLARHLAPALGLTLIDKDDILERLFDARGIGDAAWRRALSREADALLEQEARRSQGAVLASFWHADGMALDSGTPIGWIRSLGDVVVNVACDCPTELAAERFRRRTRHQGHLDAERSLDSVVQAFQALARMAPLDIGQRIRVDTSCRVDVAQVAGDVRKLLATAAK